jgi:hypothetical protein
MAVPVLPPPPSGPALLRWLQQLWSTVSRLQLAADGPSITQGDGAPAVTQPNGSLYLRTDGTGPNLYVRENGAWVAK